MGVPAPSPAPTTAATIPIDLFSTSFDFECCQCYLSKLPETGHTDDVQLGALGANDDYGHAVAAPTQRRRLAHDVTTTPLQRFKHEEQIRREAEKTAAAVPVDDACAVCGAGGDWVEDLCVHPVASTYACPRGLAR